MLRAEEARARGGALQAGGAARAVALRLGQAVLGRAARAAGPEQGEKGRGEEPGTGS